MNKDVGIPRYTDDVPVTAVQQPRHLLAVSGHLLDNTPRGRIVHPDLSVMVSNKNLLPSVVHAETDDLCISVGDHALDSTRHGVPNPEVGCARGEEHPAKVVKSRFEYRSVIGLISHSCVLIVVRDELSVGSKNSFVRRDGHEHPQRKKPIYDDVLNQLISPQIPGLENAFRVGAHYLVRCCAENLNADDGRNVTSDDMGGRSYVRIPHEEVVVKTPCDEHLVRGCKGHASNAHLMSLQQLPQQTRRHIPYHHVAIDTTGSHLLKHWQLEQHGRDRPTTVRMVGVCGLHPGIASSDDSRVGLLGLDVAHGYRISLMPLRNGLKVRIVPRATLALALTLAHSSAHELHVPSENTTLVVGSEWCLSHNTPAHHNLGGLRLEASQQLETVVHVEERKRLVGAGDHQVLVLLNVLHTQWLGYVPDLPVRNQVWGAQLETLGTLFNEGYLVPRGAVESLFHV
mmetsp:Transcript_1986/g.5648  ORF Transcript_1986/g.5648 Transcript_1986/m.5648 type:complete len:457 (-) Transcript_1986:1239-2609(-)